MLTAPNLMAAAHVCGIFAKPVRSGAVGNVLLGSLHIDLEAPSQLAALIEFRRRGTLLLVSTPQSNSYVASVLASLRERDLDTQLLRRSCIQLDEYRFYAMRVTARAATARNITTDQILAARDQMRPGSTPRKALDRLHQVGLERGRSLLEIAATAWNRQAGIQP